MEKIKSTDLLNTYLYTKDNYNPFNISNEIYKSIQDKLNLINYNTYVDKSQISLDKILGNIYGLFSQTLVPNYNYLVEIATKAALILSNPNKSFIDFQTKNLLNDIITTMGTNNDKLSQNLEKIVSYYSNNPQVIFNIIEFIYDNFKSQSGWVTNKENLPEPNKLIQIQYKAIALKDIINKKQIVDLFIQNEIKNFLKDIFAISPNLKNTIDLNNPLILTNKDFWLNFLSIISDSLSVVNEFIKPYNIKDNTEASKLMTALYYLNLSKNNPSNIYSALSYINNDHKNIINTINNEYLKFGLNSQEINKNLANNLYNTYVGILASYFKGLIKKGDLSNGDCLDFLTLYLKSSIILDYINSTKEIDNNKLTNMINDLRTFMSSKPYLKDLYNLSFTNDLTNIKALLEVLKRIGQKVAPWVISKSPNMPKNREFWLRTNLLIKILQKLDKKDPNYNNILNQLENYFKNQLIPAYTDTLFFNTNIINNIYQNNIYNDKESFINNFSSILNTIAGFPIATKFDSDYLFSNIILSNYLKEINKQLQDNKNNNTILENYQNNTFNQLLLNIMSKDTNLMKVIYDYNFYKNIIKEDILKDALLDVISTFYGASSYYLDFES
ncbi:MAG: hypothetical protein N2485_00860 [bacterium]|nr:hypothetical protein [bacterium]